MLLVSIVSALQEPQIMLAIAGTTLILNLFVAWKGAVLYKKKEMDKKASIGYVDDQIKAVRKEGDLQIEAIHQSNEETRSLIENMSKQVQFIYEKHYTP